MRVFPMIRVADFLWERSLPANAGDAVFQGDRVIVLRGQAPLPQESVSILGNCVSLLRMRETQGKHFLVQGRSSQAQPARGVFYFSGTLRQRRFNQLPIKTLTGPR